MVLEKLGTRQPKALAARPADYLESQRKLTRALFEQLWALSDDALGDSRGRLLAAVARFDLRLAHKWADDRRSQGGVGASDARRLSTAMAIVDAEEAARDDANKAVAFLAPLSAEDATAALLQLAKRFSGRGDSRSLRFVTEAVSRSKAMPASKRAVALADAGALLLRLDRPDEGKRRILEAADLADALRPDGETQTVRNRVAVRLASIDLKRALTLIPRQPRAEVNRWRVELLGRLPPGGGNQWEAVSKLFESVDASSAGILQGAIMSRLTPKPKVDLESIKWSLIGIWNATQGDRAYQEYRSSSAWHVYQARLAGDPNLPETINLALSIRPTTKWFTPERLAADLAEIAMTLALTDPVTARQVLDQALPAGRPTPGDLGDQRSWLFALALADPERAMPEIARRIERVKTRKATLSSTSLLELAEVLTYTSDEGRFQALTRLGGWGWSSEVDD
jgi:hypothetical protein